MFWIFGSPTSMVIARGIPFRIPPYILFALPVSDPGKTRFYCHSAQPSIISGPAGPELKLQGCCFLIPSWNHDIPGQSWSLPYWPPPKKWKLGPFSHVLVQFQVRFPHRMPLQDIPYQILTDSVCSYLSVSTWMF